MDILVTEDGLECGGRRYRCSLGRSGIGKRRCEYDGRTPKGAWPLRRVFYRPDKVDPPETGLQLQAIEPDDLWVDDPEDPQYNRLVKEAECTADSFERMWRPDDLYDVAVEIGFNDAPVVPGKGSAIFFHVARPDYAPKEGCVGVSLAHLLEILKACQTGTSIIIR